MKKQIFSLALIIALFGFSSCEDWINSDVCTTYKIAADLFMDNQVMVDGQQKQNLLIHNIRTGEVFFGGENPVYDFQLGDWLEVGVVVFNDYLADECSEGADAPPTLTEPLAVLRDELGNIGQYPLSLAWTPSIANGDYQITASTMQFNYPGDYYFGFEANQGHQVEEHSFSNNDYSSITQDYDGLTGGGSDGLVATIRIPGTITPGMAAARTNPISQLEVASIEAAHNESKLVSYFNEHLRNRITAIKK